MFQERYFLKSSLTKSMSPQIGYSHMFGPHVPVFCEVVYRAPR